MEEIYERCCAESLLMKGENSAMRTEDGGKLGQNGAVLKNN